MENQVAIIEREIADVERKVLNRAAMIEDFNGFLFFYFTYLMNYIPVLEFAIENLPENSIAKLANFGMLIDHISEIQLDRVIAVQNEVMTKNIIERTKQSKSDISRNLNNMAIAQKIQVSSGIILSSSIARDFSLSLATSKFCALNQIIAWSNIFGQFTSYPALIESFVDEEILNKAEEDLLQAKKLIQQKDRHYDHDLARDWYENAELPEAIVEGIPKFLIGPKLAWLEAMEGLELAKCVTRKDINAGQKALSYNKKILKIMKNKNLAENEWSYRNLNSGGPSFNVKDIIGLAGEGRIKLSIIDSHTIFIQSQKTKFFITIPSNFNFYINENMMVNVSEEYSIPISHDINAITSFYQNPAHFVVNNIEALSAPGDSFYYSQKAKDRKNIELIINDVDSINTKIFITYGGLNKTISKIIEETCTTTFEGLIVYGFLLGIENVAKCAGLPTEASLWSDTRVAITGIFLSRVKLFSKQISKAMEEKSEIVDNNDTSAISIEDKLADFYKGLEDSHEKFDKAFKELNDSELSELIDISFNIREILLSGLCMEEIKEKLENHFESLC